jgi:CDP-glucose 4,6-dehydratase
MIVSDIRKRVLVTGHMGFIGAWTALLFKSEGWSVFGLDDRSSWGERLYDVSAIGRLMDGESACDVADLVQWQEWVAQIQPTLIVHLAGQAIVPRAFRQPYLTYRSNALGTLAVLEAARVNESVRAAVCITSDKVYENNGDGHQFSENDPLGGGDIYSVSKSSSELIAKAYNNSHRVGRAFNIQTVRLGNVVGGGDWSKNRLIPDLIHAARSKNSFRVRYLDATRPFQHVSDVSKGILRIALAAIDGAITSGDAWNLGPKDSSFARVRDVIELFKEYYPELDVIDDEEKVKEDLKLSVNVAKYSNRFSPPRDNSIEALVRTMKWYQAFYAGSSPIELMESDLY